MKLLTALTCLALITAPQAHADQESHRDWLQWDTKVAPMGPTSAMASIDANTARTYPPAGAPDTYQVYATPPGVGATPSADNYCGTTTSQAQTPSDCPAGWDMWYR